jgi:hypothetical protein
MKYKLIACKALFRELCHVCSTSENAIDLTFIRQGYHNTPEVLWKTLQAEIDAVETGNDLHSNEVKGDNPSIHTDFDAILIGYGLCSNGIIGLMSKKYPLVIPRGHDCITFFTGSKERYKSCFEERPGTFWYTASWFECGCLPTAKNYEDMGQYYRDRGYDEEDIEFIMESNKEWIEHYNYAGYINMPFYDNVKYREYARKAASDFGWKYAEIDGDISLLASFVNGNWNPNDFLIVQPGQKVAPSYDDGIIRAEE